jgi:hypothetical protein
VEWRLLIYVEDDCEDRDAYLRTRCSLENACTVQAYIVPDGEGGNDEIAVSICSAFAYDKVDKHLSTSEPDDIKALD